MLFYFTQVSSYSPACLSARTSSTHRPSAAHDGAGDAWPAGAFTSDAALRAAPASGATECCSDPACGGASANGLARRPVPRSLPVRPTAAIAQLQSADGGLSRGGRASQTLCGGLPTTERRCGSGRSQAQGPESRALEQSAYAPSRWTGTRSAWWSARSASSSPARKHGPCGSGRPTQEGGRLAVAMMPNAPGRCAPALYIINGYREGETEDRVIREEVLQRYASSRRLRFLFSLWFLGFASRFGACVEQVAFEALRCF